MGDIIKKINEKVIFAGVHKHIEKYYQAMDYFLLPSLYEGFGIVALEAQCASLPCILSTNIPHSINIFPQKTFFLDININAYAWANKIMETKNLNRNSNVQINSKYNIFLEAKKLQDKYAEIINNK